MGYEIAGGLGVKLACPDREVIVMVGDGSYLMMNSEIATSVMLGVKLIIVVLDNRGFGCINRLQRATGGESFNNLLEHTRHETLPAIDFAAHAASLGASASKVAGLAELEAALKDARKADRTSVIVIDTDPLASTEAGGHWWDVAVPEVSERAEVRAARANYETALKNAAAGRLRMAVRIGANPIGWSNDDMRELGGATPLETCLAEAKEAGFEGMELGHKFPREPKALAAVLGKFGLSPRVRLVFGRAAAPRRRRRDASICGRISICSRRSAATCWCSPRPRTRSMATAASRSPTGRVLAAADWAQFGQRMTEVGDRTLAEGVRLVYHHHMGTVVESEAEIDALMAATGPSVHLLLDTGHATFGGRRSGRAGAALSRAHQPRAHQGRARRRDGGGASASA